MLGALSLFIARLPLSGTLALFFASAFVIHQIASVVICIATFELNRIVQSIGQPIIFLLLAAGFLGREVGQDPNIRRVTLRDEFKAFCNWVDGILSAGLERGVEHQATYYLPK